MKSKMLMLVSLCVSASAQARTIRIPSLETLKARLARELNNSSSDVRLKVVIEQTNFFENLADKQMEPAAVVRQIKGICLVNALGRQAFNRFLMASTLSYQEANKAAAPAEDEAIKKFFEKEGKIETISEKRLAQLYGGETSFSLATEVLSCQIAKLYRVFFKDMPALLEELIGLYVEIKAAQAKENRDHNSR